MSDTPISEDELFRLMDEDVQILVLVQGTLADGSPHYAYVSIPPSRYQAFKEAEASGNYDLAAYGKILAHGAGKEPTSDVQSRMRQEYGANHRFEEEINQWIEQLQRLQPKGN
jgi:hypothetical protein